MTTTDEYVPSDEDAVDNYVAGRGSDDPGLPLAELRAEYGPEFDRFLARVRREAALSTYAAAYRAGWLDGQNGSLPDPRMAYPEETP